MIIFIIVISACSKQESSSIQDGETRNQSEIERLEACSLVNFNKGVLLHYNMILMFKCTKWDLEFPQLNLAIRQVPSESWDHFMAPIDKEFVENISRRDRVFRNIKELDSKNGLDDLSRVLVALNETNFFDALNSMLGCAENPTLESCAARDQIPQKRSLINIIRIIDSDPQTILKASNLIKFINSSIVGNEEKLRDEINKFIRDPMFIELRLRLVDAIALKFKSGFSTEDRNFLSKMLLTGASDESSPWVYSWLSDPKMTREKFKVLMEFPALTNPDLVKQFKGLKLAYDDNFNCTIKDTTSLNELLTFDFKSHLKDHVSVLKERDYKSYFDYASAFLTGAKTSLAFCSELEVNKYGFSFIQMINKHAQFLGEKKFYDLFKFVLAHSTAKGDSDKNFSENLYFFDLLAGRVFSTANEVNESVLTLTREMYPIIYDILKNVPIDAYLDLGEVLQNTLNVSNDPRFVGVADFWNFFTPNEKNFVFNFVDRHFEGDTQFLLLFDFYSKFLDDMSEVQPVFRDKWLGSSEAEEMSYLALQELFKNLAGKETLIDFKKFFGRDQILKVLEVISNGNNINAVAKEELNYRKSDVYVTRMRTEMYRFDVTYKPKDSGDYDSKPILECMKVFSEIENGFYYLVRKLPEVCTKVSNENIAFKVFGWLNAIEKSYKEFKPSNENNDSLLSEAGILSPYMLNSFIGTGKILDSLVGDVDSVLPTKNGLRYLANSARQHLFEKNAASLLDKNVNVLSRWIDILPEKNIVHRNAIIKEMVKENNFKYSNEVFKSVADLMIQYADWIKNGMWEKASKRSLGEYNPAHDCEKVINKFVAPHPCPSKEVVKKHTNEIIKYLTTSWEAQQGTATRQLLLSVKPGEGISIPLGTNQTKKYQLTLKETMKYLYDTSDKNLANVNRQKTYYVNKDNYFSNEILTTLERVEIVIRDVRFDNNYLGAAFLNAITHTNNYNQEAADRKKLMSQCLKIPIIRCARSMSNDDLRMANNALVAFDSLIDVNNGRGLEPKLNYGNFLKTFEQTLVGSSAKAAQEVQLLPLSDSLLLKHNGRLLGDMTMMTMWSNTARVIRDRVGRTRKEFDDFIESPALNRVNRSLLIGFDLNTATPSAERLLRKLQIVPAGEKQSLVDTTIDWVSALNYNQTRLLEDTISRLLLVGSYLGPPEIVFSKSVIQNSRFDRYKENNLYQMFLAIEKFIDHYPTLKNYLPSDMMLIEGLKPINTALVFLSESLASSNDPVKNTAYLALNDLFNALQVFLFDKLPDPSILKPQTKPAPEGLELLLSFLNNPKNVNQTYLVMRDDYRYLSSLHGDRGNWFRSFGQNLKRVTESNKINLNSVREYLTFSTKNGICLRGQACRVNYQFDELANLIKYLGKTNQSGETYLYSASKKILVENFDQLQAMMDDLLPSLKIKEVRTPLR